MQYRHTLFPHCFLFFSISSPFSCTQPSVLLLPLARAKKSELTDFARAVLFEPQEKSSVQNFVLFILRAQNDVPCVQNFVLVVLRAPFFDF